MKIQSGYIYVAVFLFMLVSSRTFLFAGTVDLPKGKQVFRTEEVSSDYAPREVSVIKAVLYPFALLATPFIFPGYYALTDEPKINNSFDNYMQWIYYKVPAKASDVDFEAVNFPLSDYKGDDVDDVPVDVQDLCIDDSYINVKPVETKAIIKDAVEDFDLKDKGHIKEKTEKKKTRSDDKEKPKAAKKNKSEKYLKDQREQAKKEIKSEGKVSSNRLEIKFKKYKGYAENNFSQGKFSLALKNYKKALKYRQEDKELLTKIAELESKIREEQQIKLLVLEKEAEMAEALKEKKAKEKNDNKIQKMVNLTDKYIAKKQYNKALKTVDYIFELDPSNSYAEKTKLTVQVLKSKQQEESRVNFKENKNNVVDEKQVTEKKLVKDVVALSPEKAKKLMRKAEKLYKKGNYYEAAELFRSVAEFYPDNNVVKQRLKSIEYMNRLFERQQ